MEFIPESVGPMFAEVDIVLEWGLHVLSVIVEHRHCDDGCQSGHCRDCDTWRQALAIEEWMQDKPKKASRLRPSASVNFIFSSICIQSAARGKTNHLIKLDVNLYERLEMQGKRWRTLTLFCLFAWMCVDITGINTVKGKERGRGWEDALQLVSYYIISILYALCHVCCCYTSFSSCLLVCTAREITK